MCARACAEARQQNQQGSVCRCLRLCGLAWACRVRLARARGRRAWATQACLLCCQQQARMLFCKGGGAVEVGPASRAYVHGCTASDTSTSRRNCMHASHASLVQHPGRILPPCPAASSPLLHCPNCALAFFHEFRATTLAPSGQLQLQRSAQDFVMAARWLAAGAHQTSGRPSGFATRARAAAVVHRRLLLTLA